MTPYPRLDLEDPDKTPYWIGNAHDFWRNVGVWRTTDQSQAVQDTLEDVVRYCTAFPDCYKRRMVLPEYFVEYTSRRKTQMLTVVAGIDAIVRTGAAPTNLGMLSNWVGMLEFDFEPLEGASGAWSLRETVKWLTQQEQVHPWDSAIVFMAAQMTHEYSTPKDSEALALVCATDSNADRMTMRLMTVMEHTPVGNCWWKTINGVHGGASEMPMPAMPLVRNIIARPERAGQAWWRYANELDKTPEYLWIRSWVGSLTSLSRDENFSINGLL